MTDDDEAARPTETTPAANDDDAGTVASVRRVPVFDEIREVANLRVVDRDRYEVGAEIARGGMGRVLEAWDSDQKRRVAIKVLLRGGADSARRFVREARVTARLQHPSIVPLYEVARWPTGEPFFAMKLVAGRSLADVVSHAKTLDAKLALLPHLVDATEALAYAHDEGIVHRDLKPSNVLVGRFGETVVIDWGLAKDVREPDDDPLPSSRRDSGRSAQLTALGQALGTPCYMAPEQARGETVDRRTDVYALGAMLYHALAGAPPYDGESSKATIERVLAEPPAPLGTRAPDAPRDLVALVEKAMARDPADRYPSAKEMAADLERFVAGQRVSAHTYSIGALVGRWIARHRAVVAVASAMLCALIVTSVLSVRRIARERDRADEQKVIADAERRAAVLQRDGAERLVEFMLGDLRTRLEPVGRLDVLGGVASKVDEYYRTTFPSAELRDAAALLRRAEALATLGGVESSKRNIDAARAAYLSSVQLAERALRIAPESEDAELRAAESHARLAELATGEGNLDEAAREIGASRALLARHIGASRWLLLAAKLDGDEAFVKQQQGDLAGAYAAAVAARDGMLRAAADPRSADAQRDLAWAWQQLGDLEMERADLDAAVAAYREAVTVRERNKGDARDAAQEHDRGWGHAAVGIAELARGDARAALVSFKTALAIRSALVARDPENAVWRRHLAYSHTLACDAELAIGSIADATNDCKTALGILDALAGAAHDDAKLERDLALAHKNLGKALLAAHRQVDAMTEMRAAVDVAERIVAARPDNTTTQQVLLRCRRWLGTAELAAKKLDAARASYLASLEQAERLAATTPDDPTAREEVAAARLLGGDVEAALGERARARDLYRAAFEGYSALAARSPHDATIRASQREAKRKLECVDSGGCR